MIAPAYREARHVRSRPALPVCVVTAGVLALAVAATAQQVPRCDHLAPRTTSGTSVGKDGFANLRIGGIVSHGAQLVVGLDVTLTRVQPIHGLLTRIDGTLLAPFNSRAFPATARTRLALTLDQVYAGPLTAPHRVYAGLGAGPFFGAGPASVHLGAKVFVGGYVTPAIGLELDGYIPTFERPSVTLEVRFAL